MPSSTFNSINWAANNWPVNSQAWYNLCPFICFQDPLARKSPESHYQLFYQLISN